MDTTEKATEEVAETTEEKDVIILSMASVGDNQKHVRYVSECGLKNIVLTVQCPKSVKLLRKQLNTLKIRHNTL